MADFNAKINLDADNSKALKKIGQVEKAVNKLDDAVRKVDVKVNTSGFENVRREVAKIGKELKIFENVVLNKLPARVQNLTYVVKAAVVTLLALGKAGEQAAAQLVEAFSGVISQRILSNFLSIQKAVDLPPPVWAKSLNRDLNITVATVERLTRAMADLRAKALPPGVQGGPLAQRGLAPQQFNLLSLNQIVSALDNIRVNGDAATRSIQNLFNILNRIDSGNRFGPPGNTQGALPFRYNPLQLPPATGFFTRNAARQNARTKPGTFDPNSLRGLREGIRYFEELLDTARIGSAEFRKYEEAIAQLNQRIKDAQLVGQRAGAAIAPRPGTLAALRQEIAAKEAALNQAKIGSKEFKNLSNSLRDLNKQVDRVDRKVKGRTKGAKGRLGTAFQSAALGGGFPLLFGGPSFSALGGGLGGFAGGLKGPGSGFAGGIIGSALGSAIDALTQKATELGQALLKPTTNIDTLISSLGITGTRLESTIKTLRDLGYESVAAAVAVDSLEEKYGKDTVDALRGLGKEFTEFQNAMQTLGVRIAALLAGPLGGMLKLLAAAAGSAGNAQALGLLSQNLSSENRKKFSDRLNELTNGAGISGFISDQTLQTLINEFDPEAVKQAAKASQIRAKAEKIITQELRNQLEEARSATNLETVRLTARRDTLATIKADIAIAKQQRELAKAILNWNLETEASKKRQLNNEKNIAAEALKRLQTARANAIIEAQRQITRDVSSQNQAFAQARSTSLGITQQIYDLTQSQAVSYEQQQKLLKDQSNIQMQLLAERREIELLGKTEVELIDSINRKYDELEEQEKRRLTLQIERARQAEVMRRYREQEITDNRELARLDAQRNAALEIRSMDFTRQAELNRTGGGFFGASSDFSEQRRAQTAAQLENYNEQIGTLQSRIRTLNDQGIDPDIVKPLTDKLADLTSLRDTFAQLQPAIDNAAIAQARYNDAFAVTNPIIQSAVSNFREVVAGTKTAEEAFASFLKTIADMLAQTAAVMIAQYIAIGVARMFAVGATPTKGSTGVPGLEPNSYYGTGGRYGSFVAPSGEGGGFTGFGPRSGGVDGRGGFPAILHPNETVIDHTRPNVMGGMGGDTTVNITINESGNGQRTATGSDPKEAARLARLIETSTLAVINREKRPGGSLSR